MLELETECQAKDGLTLDAQSRVARLTADNVKLYEKIRFLQSLVSTANSDSAGATSQSIGVRARGAAGAPSPYATAADEDFERPYNKLYTESLDPFTDFSRREKARRYASLSAAEKITLTSSRIVLASKFARTAVLIYVVVMHLLVVATLWHFGHVSHKGCGDHTDHLIDGATLGGPSAAEPVLTPRERLIERLLPTRLRGAVATPAAAGAGVAAGGSGSETAAEAAAAASNAVISSGSSSGFGFAAEGGSATATAGFAPPTADDIDALPSAAGAKLNTAPGNGDPAGGLSEANAGGEAEATPAEDASSLPALLSPADGPPDSEVQGSAGADNRSPGEDDGERARPEPV